MGKRGRPPAVSEEDKDKFLSDYYSEGTATAVAKKWGMSLPTALSTLRRFGIDTGRPPSPKSANLGAYHPKLGVWSDSRVAEVLGVSRQAVHRARKRRGLQSALSRAMKIVSGE